METGERNGQQELILSLNNRVSENKKQSCTLDRWIMLLKVTRTNG